MAAAVVTPLIGTGITPNHLTTLRLATGIGACAAVALGSHAGMLWGGGLWLLSAFLDRADGELARIGDMMSPGGHRYDYIADVLVNSLLFVAAGIGVRHGWLGVWAMPLGLLATVSMLVCWVTGEAYQQLEGSGAKAYAGRWGFDIDDGLYLIAPLIWFGLMSFVVLGAAIATSIMAVIILVRLQLLRSRLAQSGAAGSAKRDKAQPM
ncbi:CDP-alcohol phosphatidyltransferase family protein [Caulobacter sp. S45]|uniref:CDP-alcohol phosphatidyltransferase family protein n=1 Tax=Caulobacter sp. S45 TaxID=1641861 RepID=UPI00131D57A6|nr:CDP-alcohol phosphatidyltransferase family protein [Caulobacter sp. S45]